MPPIKVLYATSETQCSQVNKLPTVDRSTCSCLYSVDRLHTEQQAGSKQEQEYVKAVYCHLAYLTSMQSTS